MGNLLLTSSPPHILIVDDDPAVRRLLRLMLTQDGCRVTEAGDGQQGVDAYAAWQPDLVLLDLMMPVMDGLDACRLLAFDAGLRNVPILVMTSLDDDALIDLAFEAGATDYLTKPLNYTAVRRRLRHLLRSKQVEDAIRRAKCEWEATLDAVSDLVLLTGADDRVVRCNRAVTVQLQQGYQEVRGRTLAELFYGELQATPEFYQAQAGPLQFPRLRGWYDLSNYSVTLSDQQAGAVHVLRDVTRQVELENARQAAVEALRQSEAKLRSYITHAPLAWFVTDRAGRCVEFNPAAEALLDYDGETLGRLGVADVLADDDRQAGWQSLSTVVNQGYAEAELRLKKRGGELIWVSLRAVRVAGDRFMAFCQDITQRKQAEESLAMQASVLANMAEGVCVSDAESDLILLTNPAFDAMFGYERGELVGQPVTALNALTVQENEALMATLREEIGARGHWAGELPNRRKDGTTFTSAAHLSLATLQGRSVRVSVQTDITEQKQSRDWVLHVQKLADLGTLAAGVAHEMNSPLQVITGVSQSLLRRLESGALAPDYLRRNLDVVHRNGWRCAEIVRSLHTYARVSGGAIALADLNELVQDTLLLIEHQLRSWSNIIVHTQLSANLPPLECDRNQIVQILINLLTNARDAMPDGGDITVTTGFDPDARQLVLQVADTGVGIPDSIRTKIFDPFFTTKPVGKGTGLGLSIVAGIVRAYNGAINMESQPGAGTTFKLLFPIHRPRLPEPPASGRFNDAGEVPSALTAPAPAL